MRALLLVVALLVLGGAALGLALKSNGAFARRENPVTADAYVAGEHTPLAAQLAGYVHAVLVEDNANVKAGQRIVAIDDADYRAAVAGAAAQVTAAQAAVTALAGRREVIAQQLRQTQASIDAADAELAHAANEVRRQQLLLPTAAGLLQGLQSAQADARRLQATRDQATAQAGADARQLDLLAAQTASARAQVAEAEAELALAQIALGRTQIAAPVDGTLGEMPVHEGSLLVPGTPVAELTPLDRLWVSANFTERQITDIRVGQRAEVHVDALGPVAIRGTVAGIQPATGAAFSLVPADNSTGNFTKVVARVPVKIALDLAGSGLAGRLRPGMSAHAKVFTTEAPK